MKKILSLGVILLFIGVAVAPSINVTVVKASDDNDLVEVTAQACGIKGYGNTTVKLTRQQYQNLEEYLVEFRERLNQTSTRAESVPIFKEAVVELDKYGLLPKGMSVEQAESLVLSRFNTVSRPKSISILLPHTSPVVNDEEIWNANCIVLGQSMPSFKTIFSTLGTLIWAALFGVPIAVILFFYMAYITWGQFPHPLLELLGAGTFVFMEASLRFLASLGSHNGNYSHASIWLYGVQGWIQTIGGDGGNQSMNGTLWGQLDAILGGGASGPAVQGFTGFTTRVNDSSETFFMGSAALVGVGHRPKN